MRPALYGEPCPSSVEYAGQPLSRYEVEYQPGTGSTLGKLIQVRRPELFESTHLLPQPRLVGLEALGDGWLKALKLDCVAAAVARFVPLVRLLLLCRTLRTLHSRSSREEYRWSETMLQPMRAGRETVRRIQSLRQLTCWHRRSSTEKYP